MSKAERFIELNTKKYSNETRITIGRNSHWEKQPWLTPEQALAAVKIAREELIDRACEWLNNFYSEDRHCYLVAEDIKAFKQAMEESK